MRLLSTKIQNFFVHTCVTFEASAVNGVLRTSCARERKRASASGALSMFRRHRHRGDHANRESTRARGRGRGGEGSHRYISYAAGERRDEEAEAKANSLHCQGGARRGLSLYFAFACLS